MAMANQLHTHYTLRIMWLLLIESAVQPKLDQFHSVLFSRERSAIQPVAYLYLIRGRYYGPSMELTRNSETAQRTAPKCCMQIPIRLRRTRAGSNVDRVHHLEENWNFKTKFRTLQLAAANAWKVTRPQWQCRGSSTILLQCCISRSAACIMYSLPQALHRPRGRQMCDVDFGC